jgi:RNA polymerase sigma factor (sigma-70 family)
LAAPRLFRYVDYICERELAMIYQVGAISGWLFRIVDRYCVRLTMRALRVPRAVEAEALERRFSSVPAVELRIDIARAIESLPPHYREIVVLRDLEELTIDEIAAGTRATRESVKARLHRARSLLRDYLTDEG